MGGNMKGLILSSLILSFSFASASMTETLKTFRTFDNLEIRGKIARPNRAAGLRPGVLLIHGAGPFDMNLWMPGHLSTTGQPHKAFETIAQNLADNGIVSFRYNKRGMTDQPTGGPIIDNAIYEAATIEILARDAVEALKVLKSDPSVDPQRIVILGLSQGTMVAPLVAQAVGGVWRLALLSSIGSAGNAALIASLKIPSLLLHGEADIITPVGECQMIANALKSNGVDFKKIIYPGLGHGFSVDTVGRITLGPIRHDVVEAIPAWINSNNAN